MVVAPQCAQVAAYRHASSTTGCTGGNSTTWLTPTRSCRAGAKACPQLSQWAGWHTTTQSGAARRRLVPRCPNGGPRLAPSSVGRSRFQPWLGGVEEFRGVFGGPPAPGPLAFQLRNPRLGRGQLALQLTNAPHDFFRAQLAQFLIRHAFMIATRSAAVNQSCRPSTARTGQGR